MIDFVLLFIGFVLLIKGADFIVDASSALAKSFSVSTLVIGLTIVAFGTSLPELVVSMQASLSGENNLALGNIIGSNTSNIWLMLGVCALIAPLKVKRVTVIREIPYAILAIVLLLIFANDEYLSAVPNLLSRGEGFALIAYFIIFLYYNFYSSRSFEKPTISPESENYLKDFLLLLSGFFALIFGGRIIVDSATNIALMLGLSSAFIGLTIVAIGTSLPELAASAVAVYKGETDLAIGNVVGSNIFNIFLVIGINIVIKPISYDPILNFDILISVLSIMMLFIILLSRKHMMSKLSGILFLSCYLFYLSYLINRG